MISSLPLQIPNRLPHSNLSMVQGSAGPILYAYLVEVTDYLEQRPAPAPAISVPFPDPGLDLQIEKAETHVVMARNQGHDWEARQELR
jgi:hypothetical protein